MRENHLKTISLGEGLRYDPRALKLVSNSSLDTRLSSCGHLKTISLGEGLRYDPRALKLVSNSSLDTRLSSCGQICKSSNLHIYEY